MTEMTDKEKEAEVKRIEWRKAELANMSDAYLDELVRMTYTEHTMIAGEIERRKSRRATLLIKFPCTLRELETSVHSYGDHYGFHGRVVVFPVADAGSVNMGIGVEDQA